jgi:TPR repeat protein
MKKTALFLLLFITTLQADLLYQADSKYARKDYYSAYLDYFKACNDHNNAQACYMTALIYQKGQGINVDLKDALSFYKKACTLGNNAGCREYKSLYSQATRNPSINELTRACNNNESQKCKALANYYYSGTASTIPQNYYQALYYYEKSCDMGDATACTAAAQMYGQGTGTARDVQKAELFKIKARRQSGNTSNTYTSNSYYNYQKINQLKSNCKRGIIADCNSLGILYYEGKEAPKDYKAARHYYTKACQNSDAYGCFNLAILYEYGLGVNKNKRQALEYYDRSCKSGYNKGCEKSRKYVSTRPLKTYNNTDTGKKEKQQSSSNSSNTIKCNQGNGKICNKIGVKLQKKRKYDQALYFFKRGCEFNNNTACFNLGSLYENGRGVEKNNILANKYYQRACNTGFTFACKKIKK